MTLVYRRPLGFGPILNGNGIVYVSSIDTITSFPGSPLPPSVPLSTHHIHQSLARNDDMNEIMIPVRSRKSLRFLLDDLVADFPKCRGAGGTVDVVVLVEPVTQHATAGAQPADLHALGPPALFAVEDRERRPSDRPAGRLPYRACG